MAITKAEEVGRPPRDARVRCSQVEPAAQSRPFGLRPVARVAQKLEVHEHCFIRGPKANKSWLYKFSHSHEGGDVPHQHADTGPASYTIDKDEWLRATGLSGGTRKKFTAKPNGEQLAMVALEKHQTEFDVVVCAPPPSFRGEGAGMAPAARMALAFGMTANVKSGSAA